jgi:hypothetical protein
MTTLPRAPFSCNTKVKNTGLAHDTNIWNYWLKNIFSFLIYKLYVRTELQTPIIKLFTTHGYRTERSIPIHAAQSSVKSVENQRRFGGACFSHLQGTIISQVRNKHKAGSMKSKIPAYWLTAWLSLQFWRRKRHFSQNIRWPSTDYTALYPSRSKSS